MLGGHLYYRDGSGVVACRWSQASELEARQRHCISHAFVSSPYILPCEGEIVYGCSEKQNSDKVHYGRLF